MNIYEIIREHRKLMTQRRYWKGVKREQGYMRIAALAVMLRKSGIRPE